MSAAQSASPPLPWFAVALRAGLVAGLLGSAALALGYSLMHPDVPPFHSWPVSVASILLSGALSGASLGLAICGGMVVARRRGGRAVHEVFGAAGGAVVGGLLPSAIGVLGFGSLSTPYIGTDLAAAGVLVAALILGTLLSLPAATGRVSTVSRGATLACSALASALVIIPFGLTIAGLTAAELPLPVIRKLLRLFHAASGGDFSLVLGAFSAALAVVFGAIVGAAIGIASNLAALLRQSWSLTARRPPT
jgi:hypothetical protein